MEEAKQYKGITMISLAEDKFVLSSFINSTSRVTHVELMQVRNQKTYCVVTEDGWVRTIGKSLQIKGAFQVPHKIVAITSV